MPPHASHPGSLSDFRTASGIRHVLPGLLSLLLSCFAHAGDAPVRVHPDNPHYLEFRGQLTPLIGSSEHYGALHNLDFDYRRYLEETRACNLNLVRVFAGPYRELEDSFGIEDNTLAPADDRYVSPWARSGTPGALDGGNKYDLTKWDPAFFHRLRDFIKEAGKRGIVVEVTLFCPFYSHSADTPDAHWQASPWHPANNINLDEQEIADRNSVYLTDSPLIDYQKAFATKVMETVQPYDNVYLEVMNEHYQQDESPVPADWLVAIIDELTAADSTTAPHAIAHNVANGDALITNPHPAISIFNFHYAEANAAWQNQHLNKVIGDDETGFAGNVDLPYRTEAWTFMLAGGGLVNHLDFHFTAGREDGIASPASPGGGGPSIRRQLGLLRWFLNELPLADCTPDPTFVTGGIAADSVVHTLAKAGEAYGLYLYNPDTETNATYQNDLVLELPEGVYQGRWIDPRSGETTRTIASFTHSGGSHTLSSPTYGEDLALLLFGGATPPPTVVLTEPVYQTVAAVDSQIVLKAEATVTNGTIQSVEFLCGNHTLHTDTEAPYEYTLNCVKKGSNLYRARVHTSDGRQSSSPPVKCQVMGAFQSGVNLNGSDVTVNGQTWLSQTNAVDSGLTMNNALGESLSTDQQVYPAADPAAKNLVKDQIKQTETPWLSLSLSWPVANGTYDVFFSLIEGDSDFNRDVRATIEGQTVAEGVGELALGEWVNYGPYRITVADGALDMLFARDTKGTPKIANFSLYEAGEETPLSDAELEITSGPGVAVLTLPTSVESGKVEGSDSLGESADWQPLDVAPSNFTDIREYVVPAKEREFFRLRID